MIATFDMVASEVSVRMAMIGRPVLTFLDKDGNGADCFVSRAALEYFHEELGEWLAATAPAEGSPEKWTGRVWRNLNTGIFTIPPEESRIEDYPFCREFTAEEVKP